MKTLLTRITAKTHIEARPERRVTRAEIRTLFASELDARFRQAEAA